MSPLLSSRWRPRGLILCNLFALLLVASWLWSPTRHFWDLFDDALFVDLNGTLTAARPWAAFWAFLSLRPMDAVIALAMALFVIRADFIFPARQVRSVLFATLGVIALAFVVRVGLEFALRELHLQRSSPSLVMRDAVRLSELFPHWPITIKDSSRTSFPGDHASIELIWALLLTPYAFGWKRVVLWAVAGLALLPRLVAGAHWGSDDFVGGLALALFAIGWGCYTPYAAAFERRLEHVTARWRIVMARLPGLQRLSVLQ